MQAPPTQQPAYDPSRARGSDRERFRAFLKLIQREPGVITNPEDKKMLKQKIAFYDSAWWAVLGSIGVSFYYTYKIRKDPANSKRYMTNNLALGLSVMSVYGYALYQRSTLEKSILNKYFEHVSLQDLKNLADRKPLIPHLQPPPNAQMNPQMNSQMNQQNL